MFGACVDLPPAKLLEPIRFSHDHHMRSMLTCFECSPNTFSYYYNIPLRENEDHLVKSNLNGDEKKSKPSLAWRLVQKIVGWIL